MEKNKMTNMAREELCRGIRRPTGKMGTVIVRNRKTNKGNMRGYGEEYEDQNGRWVQIQCRIGKLMRKMGGTIARNKKTNEGDESSYTEE